MNFEPIEMDQWTYYSASTSTRGKKTAWNTRNNNYRGGRYGRYNQQGFYFFILWANTKVQSK